MSDPDQRSQTMAGGVFMALFTIMGVIAGGAMGQPSLGLLTGLALGTAVALAIWWRGRR